MAVLVYKGSLTLHF